MKIGYEKTDSITEQTCSDTPLSVLCYCEIPFRLLFKTSFKVSVIWFGIRSIKEHSSD